LRDGNGTVRDKNSEHAGASEIDGCLRLIEVQRCPQIRNSFAAPWDASPPV
jgi:hypothetical protein